MFFTDKEPFNKETAKVFDLLGKGSGEATEVIGLILEDIFCKMIKLIADSFRKATPSRKAPIRR